MMTMIIMMMTMTIIFITDNSLLLKFISSHNALPSIRQQVNLAVRVGLLVRVPTRGQSLGGNYGYGKISGILVVEKFHLKCCRRDK